MLPERFAMHHRDHIHILLYTSLDWCNSSGPGSIDDAQSLEPHHDPEIVKLYTASLLVVLPHRYFEEVLLNIRCYTSKVKGAPAEVVTV